MEKTRLSSKGQIVLPTAIPAARKWKPGQEQTRLDAAIGSAGYKGPRRSLRAMERALLREARKRR